MTISRQIFSLALLLSFGALTACGNGAADASKSEARGEAKGGGKGGGEKKPTPTVTVAPVAAHEFVDALEAVGTARAIDSVIITANVTERIKRLNFRDGQYVRRGQLLVELTATQEKADLAGSRARLKQAQAQLDRLRPLLKDGFVTQSRMDEALAARDSAQAQVETIQAQIGDRVIYAPFSGIVGLRDVSSGLVAGAATPILELSDISTIRLDFTVPETALAAVTVGQEVIGKAAAYSGEAFTGRITAIDPQIDPVNRAATVRASLPNPGGRLKPGMLLAVQAVRSKRSALAVPEQAIVGNREERSLFVLGDDGETVTQTRVTTGVREPGLVEITGGLEAGARIVVDGALKLRDGGKIKVFGEKRKPERAVKPQ
jgi:membrane fusion protein, multidrug efflux system